MHPFLTDALAAPAKESPGRALPNVAPKKAVQKKGGTEIDPQLITNDSDTEEVKIGAVMGKPATLNKGSTVPKKTGGTPKGPTPGGKSDGGSSA